MSAPCPWCEEPTDDGSSDLRHLPHHGERLELRAWHRECAMRAIFGGVNHLDGRCTCCGGTEPPDPPHLSRREAAREALRRRTPADLRRHCDRDRRS